ncbi:hypothetical protein DICPUDRAFT_58428 [Dictyostelium purpureum]|uniref:SHSP domain-containing protein n=1 Tax=Dictyostelium purpureum TaxID=5786 RepID=F1A0W8_DICPU|nr:uncharacterized protein DICPUDRAFT_58428 [Dictyostelium purpureum]EGC30168.1 hypothetical protein DICPUDRAFT_58428 [Dictyostelium purpureum]|eukprot:XP_003293313.1 hypothetical protein DICPUDRAFT_58428 [Dictyostelium purpureum]
MYLASQTPRFFFRHLFCGRNGKYYGRYYPAENMDINKTNNFNVNTTNASFTENDRNKPFYFDLSSKYMDKNLRKIDRFNECFKHFYEKHNHGDNAQYLNKIENIMEQWGREFSKNKGFRTPITETKQDDKGITITVELPGITKENVKLDYANNILNIEASNKSISNETKTEEIYEFKKSIILPENLDNTLIKAQMSNGLLKITIPKESYSNSKPINVE